MGAGIAQTCAAAGFQVTMRDIEQRLVGGGFRRIREPLAKRVERGKMSQAEGDALLSEICGGVSFKEAGGGGQTRGGGGFAKSGVKKGGLSGLGRICPLERA